MIMSEVPLATAAELEWSILVKNVTAGPGLTSGLIRVALWILWGGATAELILHSKIRQPDSRRLHPNLHGLDAFGGNE